MLRAKKRWLLLHQRKDLMFSISSIFYIPFLGILFACVINIFIFTKSQIFSEEDIIRITRENISEKQSLEWTRQIDFIILNLLADSKTNIGDIIQAIHKDLFARYPDDVVPRDDLEFMFLSAGGWNCAIYILHASVSEAIFIVGTPLDSSGHSGKN